MRTLITFIIGLLLFTSCEEEQTTPTTTIKGKVVSALTEQQFKSYDSIPFDIRGLNYMVGDEYKFTTVGNVSELPNPQTVGEKEIYVTRKPPQMWVVDADTFRHTQMLDHPLISKELYQVDRLLYNGPIKLAFYHSGGPWELISSDYIIRIIELEPPYEYEFTTNKAYEWECQLVPGQICSIDYYGMAVYWEFPYDQNKIPGHQRRGTGGVVASDEEEVVKQGEDLYMITEILME